MKAAWYVLVNFITGLLLKRWSEACKLQIYLTIMEKCTLSNIKQLNQYT